MRRAESKGSPQRRYWAANARNLRSDTYRERLLLTSWNLPNYNCSAFCVKSV